MILPRGAIWKACQHGVCDQGVVAKDICEAWKGRCKDEVRLAMAARLVTSLFVALRRALPFRTCQKLKRNYAEMVLIVGQVKIANNAPYG